MDPLLHLVLSPSLIPLHHQLLPLRPTYYLQLLDRHSFLAVRHTTQQRLELPRQSRYISFAVQPRVVVELCSQLLPASNTRQPYLIPLRAGILLLDREPHFPRNPTPTLLRIVVTKREKQRLTLSLAPHLLLFLPVEILLILC